jgi:methylglutaconyl-CoA hydratase
MPEFIKTTLSDKKAIITINRPDLHNAFNEVVIAELTDAVNALANPSTRAIVLASEGKSFCAGADLHWMKRMVDYSFDENVADAAAMANMLRTIHNSPIPVIARVHGAAFGGGVGLVAASDIAVAVENATFCLSEVKLGIIPAVISPYVLEKIGAHARRYAVTAEPFKSPEAKRIGLISDTVANADDLDPWIDNVVEAIAAAGPQAVAACKSVLRDVQRFDWKAATELTTQRISELRVSDEGQEGMNAFLQKRPPNWTPNWTNPE